MTLERPRQNYLERIKYNPYKQKIHPLTIYIIVWLILRVLFACLVDIACIYSTFYDITEAKVDRIPYTTTQNGGVSYVQLIAAGCAIYLTISIVLDIKSIIKLFKRDNKGRLLTIVNTTIILFILLLFVFVLEEPLALIIPIAANLAILIPATKLNPDWIPYSATLGEPVLESNKTNLPNFLHK